MIIETSPHSKALSQLYPKAMDAEQNAVAIVFDELLDSLDAAYAESSPSTASTTLERWESIYDLSSDGTESERWMAVRVAYAAQPGIAASNYIALALAMGFVIEIPDPPRMFRAGVSRAGQPVYDADEQYTWTVHVDAFEEACAALVSAFEEQKIPFTVIRWIWRTPPLQMSMALETQATDPVGTGVQIALGLETQATDPVGTGVQIALGLETQATDPVGTSLQTTFALEDA